MYCNNCLSETFYLENYRCPYCGHLGFSQFRFWAKFQKWLQSIDKQSRSRGRGTPMKSCRERIEEYYARMKELNIPVNEVFLCKNKECDLLQKSPPIIYTVNYECPKCGDKTIGLAETASTHYVCDKCGYCPLTLVTSEEICEHCHMPIAQRNPSGFCDHLQYPEYCEICREMKRKEAVKK